MTELNYVRRGSGEPLLLIHTLGGSLMMWEPVIDELAHHREVVAVDLPGFGASAPLPAETPPSAANLAKAILEFYESLGIDGPPSVSGISLGGWTAIECALTGRVRAAVAFCPAGFSREPYVPGRNYARIAAKVLAPVAPALVRSAAIRRRVLAGNMRHGDRTTAAQALALVRGYAGAVAYDEANRLMAGSLVGELSGLGVPLTIAWADHDTVVRNRPLEEGILPAEVRQLLLPDCGHVPTWDQPELVVKTILEGTRMKPEPEPIGGTR